MFNCPLPSKNGPLYYHNDTISPHKDLLSNHICLLSQYNDPFFYHKYFSKQDVQLSHPLSTCLLPLHNDSLTNLSGSLSHASHSLFSNNNSLSCQIVHCPIPMLYCLLIISNVLLTLLFTAPSYNAMSYHNGLLCHNNIPLSYSPS